MPARHRIALVIGLALLWSAPAAHSVDGVNEINEAFVLSTGGYPYTMPSSGSYVLTGNLAPPPGTSGLVAGDDNVEVNLNGFRIEGSPGPFAVGVDSAGFSGLVVRNGAIRLFGGPGVALGSGGKIFETTLFGNGGAGGAAIDGGFNCLIVHNVVVGNINEGVIAEHCKIENNIIAGNTAGVIGGANVIVHNQISGNSGPGIGDTGGSTIHENVLTMNFVAGITDFMAFGGVPPVPPPTGFPPRSDVMGNVIDNNFGGRGISYDTPALVTNNTVTNNFSDGVGCGAACTVRGNTIDSNNLGGAGSGGLVVADGSTVHANSISFNSGAGLTIPCTSGYTNNTLSLNSGPDVVLLGCAGSVTGPFGNNCSGGPCP